jgi:ribosomal protein S18 acetylase RimI-like enzyme
VNPEHLAALCAAAMPEERLTAGELDRLCFGEGDEIVVEGGGAAVLQMNESLGAPMAWLTLLAVEPGSQGCGVGKHLVREVAARARARGAAFLMLANAVPRYVWPGVDVANTRAGMLLESLGFERDGLAINMSIDTSFCTDPPPGIVIERELGDEARAFAQHEYPHWVPELDVAIAAGTAFAARAPDGATIAFGCHSVNRAAWIGPMATDPRGQHRGVGSAIIAALCADLAARDIRAAEIAWVSNLRFYGKCGARVSRVFLGGRLAL